MKNRLLPSAAVVDHSIFEKTAKKTDKICILFDNSFILNEKNAAAEHGFRFLECQLT
jgi:hypothetical protein